MTVTNSKSKQTLSQRRAAHAWDVVQQLVADSTFVRDGKDQGKKLGGQMKKLPTRIIAAGVGQAFSFLRAKNEAPLLEQALADWLRRARKLPDAARFEAEPDAGKSLLDELVNTWSSQDLRHHTAEALAYLPWLIRFAEAEGLMEGGE